MVLVESLFSKFVLLKGLADQLELPTVGLKADRSLRA